MPRTVVRFQESEDGVTRFSLEYPKAPLTPNRLFDLTSRPDQPPFSEMRAGNGSPNHVQEAGKILFDELSQHPAIAPAIALALQQPLGGCSPICLRVDDSALADDLPWEAVCGRGMSGVQEFFALDERWPIVRMREVMETVPVSVYTLEPPLRITVVLSAAGSTPQTRAPARPQWDRVRETVEQHLQAANPVEVKVTVFTGEEDLLNTIQAANLPWAKAELIGDKTSLLEAIKDRRPQILHFFCHGIAEGIPHLLLGSYTDWEAEHDPSIAITARELRQSDPDQNTWLVTLNCCESATRAADARSLASSLVAAGFPAAVGMREVIEVEQAHLLCKFFYPKVMEMIRQVPLGGAATEIEWAKALSVARTSFVNKYGAGVPAQEAAGSSKIWTIPALYTRRETFFLKRIAPAPPGLSKRKQDIIDYIRTLQQQRAKAAEDYKDLPPPVLNAILNDLDNQIVAKTAELLAI